MSNPFVFDGVALPGDRTAWLAGGLDPDGVVRSFSMEQTGSLIVNGMTTTESLTASGGLITPATRELNVDGDGLPVDSGYGIWPAATNLVTNGGFETNTTGWIAQQAGASGATIQRTTAEKKFGTASVLVTPNNTSQQGIVSSGASTLIAVSSSTAYTVSAWVKGTASRVHRMRVDEYSAGPVYITTQNSSQLTANGDWQRITFAFTTSGSTTLLGLNVVANEATTVPFYVDGIQLETGSIATPYIETDGSTESRTGGRIQMPVADLFTATQGAVVARVKAGPANTAYGFARLLEWDDDASNQVRISYSTSTNSWTTVRLAAAAGASSGLAGAWAAGESFTAGGAWTATGSKTLFDGAFGPVTGNTSIPTLAATSADIGSAGAANFISSNVLWLATFAGTLTDDDAAALDAFGDTPPTWAQLVSSVAICAMPTALWRAEDDTFVKASYAPDGGS